MYYFYTPSGLKYEARFNSRKNARLIFDFVFEIADNSFLNEGYELTHKHEVYAIMHSITQIFFHFSEQHPNTQGFILHALELDGLKKNKRLTVYNYFISRALPKSWNYTIEHNTISIYKIV